MRLVVQQVLLNDIGSSIFPPSISSPLPRVQWGSRELEEAQTLLVRKQEQRQPE